MPNRIIKESVCISDSIDKLSWFEEVLFYRLMVSCDDFGRFDGRPAIIKNRLFPLKEKLTQKTVEDALNKLASVDLVTPYMTDGKPYLYLPTWDKHQSIRAKKSKFPEPENICKQLYANDFNCNQMNADVPVIQSNTIQSESNARGKSQTHAHGEYGWVKLTDDQYQRLLNDLGLEELNRCIKYVDESAQQSHNKNHWTDWNLVVRKCSRDRWGLDKPQNSRKYKTAAEYQAPTVIDTQKIRKLEAEMEKWRKQE